MELFGSRFRFPPSREIDSSKIVESIRLKFFSFEKREEDFSFRNSVSHVDTRFRISTKRGGGCFYCPVRIFVRGQKNWVKGEREREREEEGWKDLLKGDLFIGDTNLGVGNVVKGGSFIVVAPYFRFSGRILSKGGPFYYLLSIFSLGRGEKILLAKHDGGYLSLIHI